MRRDRRPSNSKPARRLAVGAILMCGALAACNGEKGGADLTSLTGGVERKAPSLNMVGRWTFASPGRGQCIMTFGSAAPDAAEGTIAPQGGCPEQFYMSRKWTREAAGLVIRDHNSKPLAQLSPSADGGGFSGQSAGGAPVTLTR